MFFKSYLETQASKLKRYKLKVLRIIPAHGLIFGAKYLRMDQVKFVEDSLLPLLGCLPQILLGRILNTLPHFSNISVMR